MTERRYDVVLYGASGFTGRQTVNYFAAHTHSGELRWAIAGRDRAKLEAVRAQLGLAGAGVDILVADSRDSAAVDAMVSQTRILLTTAGPFALYGTTLVDACVRFKTHYVDITGETPWVRDLIDRYHERAAADGTRLIPCCGFDSVPSDLGALLMVRHMQREFGQPAREVRAYYQVFGGLNGGTLASVSNLYDSGQIARLRDPVLLNPRAEPAPLKPEDHRDPMAPHYDADLGAWVAPFFMGPINTRVVRRSEALYRQWHEPYGPAFTYREYQKVEGPLGMLKAAGIAGAGALFQRLMRHGAVRRRLKTLWPPGAGPSQESMDRGWFRCELLGLTEEGRWVHGLIGDRGDPGNRATVKFVCESALCLALNFDRLPGGPTRGGLLTPATGLGEVLAERLRRAGVTIRIGAS